MAVFQVSPLTKRLKYAILIPLPNGEAFVMNDVFVKKIRGFFKPLGLVMVGFLVLFGGFVIQPRAATAFSLGFFQPTNIEEKEDGSPFWKLPVASDAAPSRILIKIPVTAYSSEVGQTDSTPFITASGTTVRHGVVAANFLPIGTRVRFPELYGDKVFIVEDRMNARYYQRFDIWMEETADARNFGVHWTTVEVF
jgi:3D (Asp-Asp-Asp) domain-containing protein